MNSYLLTLIRVKDGRYNRMHPFQNQNHASIIKAALLSVWDWAVRRVNPDTSAVAFLYGINYKWVIYHMSLLTRTEQREMRRNWLWASLECTAIKMDDEVEASASPKIYCFNRNEKWNCGCYKGIDLIYSWRLDSIDSPNVFSFFNRDKVGYKVIEIIWTVNLLLITGLAIRHPLWKK